MACHPHDHSQQFYPMPSGLLPMLPCEYQAPTGRSNICPVFYSIFSILSVSLGLLFINSANTTICLLRYLLVYVLLTTLYRARKLKIKINLMSLVAFFFLIHKSHLSKSHNLRELWGKINNLGAFLVKMAGLVESALCFLCLLIPTFSGNAWSGVLGWDSILQQSEGMQEASRKLVGVVFST